MAGKSLNMQNVPVRNDVWGVKKLFVAPDDYWLVGADYAQIELRMLAYLTQDPELLKACNSNYDLHSFVASSYSGYPYEEIVEKKHSEKKFEMLRRGAKTIGFGWVYGAGDGKFQQQFGSLNAEIKAKMAYFERFSRIRPWKKEELKKFYKTGYAETILGRRRQIPEIFKSNLNKYQKFKAERECINTLVQSPSSDFQGKASCNLQLKFREITESDKKYLAVKNMVHDAIYIYVPKKNLDYYLQIIKEEMLSPKFGIDVNMAIDLEVADSWYNLTANPYYTWSGSDASV